MTLKTLQLIIAGAAVAATVVAFATAPKTERKAWDRSPEPAAASTPSHAVMLSNLNETPRRHSPATPELDRAMASEKWSATQTAKHEERPAESAP